MKTKSPITAAVIVCGILLSFPLSQTAHGRPPALPGADWYYSDGTDRKGPLKLAAIVALIKNKNSPINGNTLVWADGFGVVWEKASAAPELAAALAAASSGAGGPPPLKTWTLWVGGKIKVLTRDQIETEMKLPGGGGIDADTQVYDSKTGKWPAASTVGTVAELAVLFGPPPAVKDWYVAPDGKNPITRQDVKTRIANGMIKKDKSVWHPQKTQGWQDAGKVPDLLADFNSLGSGNIGPPALWSVQLKGTAQPLTAQTEADIVALIRSGKITATDFLWETGSPQNTRQPLSNFPNLSAHIPKKAVVQWTAYPKGKPAVKSLTETDIVAMIKNKDITADTLVSNGTKYRSAVKAGDMVEFQMTFAQLRVWKNVEPSKSPVSIRIPTDWKAATRPTSFELAFTDPKSEVQIAFKFLPKGTAGKRYFDSALKGFTNVNPGNNGSDTTNGMPVHYEEYTAQSRSRVQLNLMSATIDAPSGQVLVFIQQNNPAGPVAEATIMEIIDNLWPRTPAVATAPVIPLESEVFVYNRTGLRVDYMVLEGGVWKDYFVNPGGSMRHWTRATPPIFSVQFDSSFAPGYQLRACALRPGSHNDFWMVGRGALDLRYR